jgi:hypothetical protein
MVLFPSLQKANTKEQWQETEPGRNGLQLSIPMPVTEKGVRIGTGSPDFLRKVI